MKRTKKLFKRSAKAESIKESVPENLESLKSESSKSTLEEFPVFIKKLRNHFVLAIILVLFALVIDLPVTAFVSAIRSYYLTKILSVITSLGDVNYFFVFMVILSLTLFYYKKRVLSLWMAEIFSFAIGYGLKFLTERPRPFEVFHMQSLIPVTSSSFPSGHALAFFTLVPILSRYYPRFSKLFWAVAILVGFSRIYLGVHFLSDVLAGAFIGYIIGYICLYIVEKYDLKWF